MKVALNHLVNHMKYEIPEQDFSYDLSRMSASSKSGFVITQVRAKSQSVLEENCSATAAKVE